MSDEVKLLPCPNCGNADLSVWEHEWGWRHVECEDCDYLGPGCGSKLQAVRSHNAEIEGLNHG